MLPDRAQLRRGEAADLKAITAIERAASPGPWSLSQFVSASLRNSDDMVVAESPGGDVVGFAVYQRVQDEVTLMNIAVDPDSQGLGYGRGLLEEVVRALKRERASRLQLEVRAGNARAIELYRSVGFVDDGLREGYYPCADGREDAILMSLDLEARGERAGN